MGASRFALFYPLVGELDNLPNCNCSALITKGETTELRNFVKGFHADGLVSADSDKCNVPALDKLCLLFLLCLNIQDSDELHNFALLDKAVDVDDRLVPGAQNGLVLQELQNGELSLKGVADRHGGVLAAEDHAGRHLLLLDARQAEQQVLARPSRARLHIIAINVHHLADLLVGHHDQLVAGLDDARLRLAHHHGAHVTVLINNGHTEGGVGVAVLRLDLIQDLEQRWSVVPGANG
mmetsp:Transcript_15847/g.28131  ORF Transcript_15847/g.28131 Transcript_15847/m.28131 type:complete len:237 (+) Transcript_15847:129-839(+)